MRRCFVFGVGVVAILFLIGMGKTNVGTAEGSRRYGAPPPDYRSIIVELNDLPPSVVAGSLARRSGLSFDERSHERSVLGSQDLFLSQLKRTGIDYRISGTLHRTAVGNLRKPNRFARLINAIGLEVPSGAVERIRAMARVKHVTMDKPVHLHLDHSIEYVRANDGPGNKTIFSQGGGPLTRFDGSGQVVAILDTGIEHSHPAFDTRFDDANFLQRSGDARPVRTAGQAYQEGVHHPKVVYFLPLTGSTNEDDVGHGTHCAADSAGLKVQGPGVDRIPGNADDQIIEGVAPGALLMNYKICETLFTCVGTVNIVTALEDALSPTDVAGFPKPVATVINMSFGGTAGNPNDANAVAANNAALAGAVCVASAGNAGPNENTHGSPAAGRRVIAVAAGNDPGAATNEVDVLVQEALRYTVAGLSTGGQDDTGRPIAPEDLAIHAVIMGGAPDVTFGLGQHYVYVGFADTPEQVPDEVQGRIALASRGSTVDGGTAGTGLFGHKAAEVAAKGGIAILIFNNVDGELEAATTQASTIPAYGLSKANGEYLRDMLGFQSPTFDKVDPATWGTISDFPIRINPPDPATFSPQTTGFSSRGPLDNFQYVKPDVIASGLNVYAATIPAGGVSTGGGTMSDPSRFISVSGTSFSGPTVAGSAALVCHGLLALRGEIPLGGATLRSGASAGDQLAQFPDAPVSLVRAALTNSATNLRQGDNVTPVSDGDDTTFIHEIGSGLIHVMEAVDARAAMGTNNANGDGGPDDANDVDFLPTHSFGQLGRINTGIPGQVDAITVTIQNVSGASAAGTYALGLVDGGALRGDVTRPIVGTTGFSLSLSTPSVVLGGTVNDQVTFDVSVTVDGRFPPDGLAIAGTDVTGAQATEFLWWVVASSSNGELLRMPFYYRASATGTPPELPAPFQAAIADDAVPDQIGGVDCDGNYKLSWTIPPPPNTQPCGYQVEEATTFTTTFSDDAEETLVLGDNGTWNGDDTWTTQTHPDTGTNSYSPLYIDAANTSLTLINPIAVPLGHTVLRFDSFEDVEADFDFVAVDASGDGGPFLTLAAYTGLFSGRRDVNLSGFAGQDVLIRFRLTSDDIVSFPVFQGWFIDNVAVETADFAAIGTVDGSTFEFDVAGRPNGRYFYRIAGLFGDPCTGVGPYSNLRDITVADCGECGDPFFAGLQSVTASPGNPCALDLAWSAATPCPGFTVSYNVYRGTNSTFAPSLSNVIALGVNGWSYHDQAGLYHGTTYYYVVRAEDNQTNGGGPANDGREDDNLVRMSGSPIGPAAAAADFFDDVEPTSEQGYTMASTRDTGNWAVTTDATAHSSTNAWVSLDDQPGVPPGPKDDRLELPPLNLTSTSSMSFWHNFDFAQFPTDPPDSRYQSGGVLEISVDGNTWIDLGPYITSGGYNAAVDTTSAGPLAGRMAWTGSSDGDTGVASRTDVMTEVVVDLGAAISGEFSATESFGAGIRFRLGGTNSILIGGVQGTAWGVDDITVTGLQELSPCDTQTCGDAVVDAGEECDAGAFNSDTLPDHCRSDCTVPRCGDGVVDAGERCDDGAANSDTMPDACRTDCLPARCGDAVIDMGESCDDGATNSDTLPDACRTDCTPARCGDGTIDSSEECDDGAFNSNTTPDACRTNCASPSCGDAVVDPGEGEECDDANGVDGDGCSTVCVIETACCGIGKGCFNLPASYCQNLGGTSQDPGTLCSEPQACCLPTGRCHFVDPVCCDDLGGIAQGIGSICHLYADIAPKPTGDGIVELADVLKMLDGYSDQSLTHTDIWPCTPDGITELGDVLAVLDAYAGNPPCSDDPCP